MVEKSVELAQFAKDQGIEGLTDPSLRLVQLNKVSVEQAKSFLNFQDKINQELLCHRVIKQNQFTKWFSQGDQSLEQVKCFVVQFSVFSNLFLFAQLNKMINANSLENMRASKEILANELGVIFNSGKKQKLQTSDSDLEGDPDLVSTEGTIDGGKFKFSAAHFEWLLQMASHLDLEYNDLGKRMHGTKPTLFFCDELVRIYGNEDYEIAQAASYAVENWAAAGFWDQLVEGFKKFRVKHAMPKLPLAFFTWHSKVEAQHALHTQEELEEYFFEHDVDQDLFIKFGNEMLDGVAAFWDGLESQRKELEK